MARFLTGGRVDGFRQVHITLVVVVDVVALVAAIGTVAVVVGVVALVAATATVAPKWRTWLLYESATKRPPKHVKGETFGTRKGAASDACA